MKLVFCLCPKDAAESIGRTLVERRLAAAVSLVPGITRLSRVGSQGIDAEPETILLIEVMEESLSALRDTIVSLHPSIVPPYFVVSPDSAASLPLYVDWLRTACEN